MYVNRMANPHYNSLKLGPTPIFYQWGLKCLVIYNLAIISMAERVGGFVLIASFYLCIRLPTCSLSVFLFRVSTTPEI